MSSRVLVVMHTNTMQSGISANAWVIHQDKDVFGEDADIFRPERWMEDPDRVATMSTKFCKFAVPK